MLSVLFFLPSLAVGGAERVFVRLANHLDRGQFRPAMVVVKDTEPFAAHLRPDVEIFNCACRNHATAPWPIVRLLRRLRPDAVVSTHTHLNILMAGLRPFIPRQTALIGRESTIVSQHLELDSWKNVMIPAARMLYRKRSIRPFLRRLSFLSWFIPQEDDHGHISSRGMFREGGLLV